MWAQRRVGEERGGRGEGEEEAVDRAAGWLCLVRGWCRGRWQDGWEEFGLAGERRLAKVMQGGKEGVERRRKENTGNERTWAPSAITTRSQPSRLVPSLSSITPSSQSNPATSFPNCISTIPPSTTPSVPCSPSTFPSVSLVFSLHVLLDIAPFTLCAPTNSLNPQCKSAL